TVEEQSSQSAPVIDNTNSAVGDDLSSEQALPSSNGISSDIYTESHDVKSEQLSVTEVADPQQPTLDTWTDQWDDFSVALKVGDEHNILQRDSQSLNVENASHTNNDQGRANNDSEEL